MTTTTATTEATTEATDNRMTREDLDSLAADCGWDAAKTEATWERMEAAHAREESLEAAGLKVSYRKHLLRITNVRTCWGGHLQDGTCHYQNQTTVAGNTYPIKDSLKAAGYRWDPAARLWYRPIKASIHSDLEETKDLLS